MLELSLLDTILLFCFIICYCLMRVMLAFGGNYCIISILIFVALGLTTEVRRNIYVYFIVTFTTEKEKRMIYERLKIMPDLGNDLEPQTEAARDLNEIIEYVWPFITPFLEVKLWRKMEEFKERVAKKYFNTFWMNKITFEVKQIDLGISPPKVSNLQIFLSRESPKIAAEFDLDFKSEDSNLCLKTNLKKFLVDQLELRTRIRLEMGPLMQAPPFVGRVSIFLKKLPSMDYRVSSIPDKIKELIQLVMMRKLSQRLVFPNTKDIILAKKLPVDYYKPSGVLLIHVVEARDLTNADYIGESDPYCSVQLGSAKLTTPTVKNNLNPTWCFISQLICLPDSHFNDLELQFSVFDDESPRKVFHPLIFKNDLLLSRIREEKFLDEWLTDGEDSSGEAKSSGLLHVQILWQNLSTNYSDFFQVRSSYASLYLGQGSKEKKNTSISKDLEDLNTSSSEESDDGTDLDSSSQLNFKMTSSTNQDTDGKSDSIYILEDQGFEVHRRKKKVKTSGILYSSVLCVWLESAEDLQPEWEDFRVTMSVSNNEPQETKFIPKFDKVTKAMWVFGKQSLFPVYDPESEILRVTVISRSKGCTYGVAQVEISKLLEHNDLSIDKGSFELSKCDESTPLDSIGTNKIKGSINMSLSLKFLEPLCDLDLSRIKETQQRALERIIRRSKRLEISSRIESGLKRLSRNKKFMGSSVPSSSSSLLKEDPMTIASLASGCNFTVCKDPKRV